MLCSLNVPAPGAGDGAAQEAQRAAGTRGSLAANLRVK